jgi:hypothetical protein
MMPLLCTIFAGIVFSVAGVCQILRLVKTGSARDVSIWFIALLSAGCTALWLVVIADGNPLLCVERSLNMSVQGSVLGFTVYYKMKDRRRKDKL